MSSPATIERPVVDPGQPATEGDWIVTVYDNPLNTYDEVIEVLMLATQCTLDEAAIETWEIDHLGSSVVHHGDEIVCRDAARVIGKIGIRVEVSQERVGV